MLPFADAKFQSHPTARDVRRGLRRFKGAEDGSMTLFALFILLMMLMAGGLAVDVMRTEYTRVTIQNTLDRAVLAAADLDQTEDAKAVVIDYFEKARLSQYLNEDSIQVDNSTASGQLSFRRVSATASTDVDAIFLPMLGIDSLVAAGASTAEEGITDLEISLVVDVSGSMGWSSSSGYSKIYELKQAAKDFAFYMQCNPNAERDSGADCSVQEGKVSITMVPYSEQVAVGETLLSQFLVSDEHLHSHCVTFAENEYTSAAIPLDTELQRTGMFDPWNGRRSNPSSWTCRPTDPTEEEVDSGNYNFSYEGWRRIRPFVEDHDDLYNYIDALSAGGNTSIDVGMKWGVALLDPAARPVITNLTAIEASPGTMFVDPDFSGRPYDYGDDYSMKVIVLMTDGVNTDQHYLKDGYREGLSEIWRNTYYPDRYSIYNETTGKYYYTYDGTWNDWPYGDADGQEVTVTNTTCTWSWWYGRRCTTTTETQVIDQPGSAVQMTFPEVWTTFTTEWYKQWSWLGDPDGAYGNSTKNDRLSTICQAAKDEGIVVYSIGFEVTQDSAEVMADCASSPGHYFNADGTNLAETFGVIASSINQLRLTQ